MMREKILSFLRKLEWAQGPTRDGTPSRRRDLQDDQAWTRAILNSSYDAFIAMDGNGAVIDWNPQAEKTFGWARDEVLGRPLHLIIIPERYREAHLRGMRRFFATGEGPVLNKRIEVNACDRTGREIPVELIIYPVKQDDVTVFGAFLHDITERKRNDQLQRAQMAVTNILSESPTLEVAAPLLLERICSLLDWSAAEFWMIDREQRVLTCKSLWVSSSELKDFQERTRKLRFRRGEGLAGRVWRTGEAKLVVDVTMDPGFLRAAEARTGGLRGALAFPIKTDEQMIGVMCFYIAGPEEPGAQLLDLMADIGRRLTHFTLRREAEEKLEQLNKELEKRVVERTTELARVNDQLRAANRMKDEFLATVSHELRTPLNVMQGHSEILMDEDLPPDTRQSVEAIHRNAKAQGHIISDLLDVSRIISGKMEIEAKPINLVDVVESALETIEVAAKSKLIRIVLEVDRHLGLVSGDFHRLQQVVWNLLTNAVKFTPKGGSVTVTLRNVESRAQIQVTDTGKGIDPEFLPHVFERFRQEDASTTRRFGGLGLGLAIARHITEAHGGVIEVTSDGKDQGTTFTVTLPFLATRDESLSKRPRHKDLSSVASAESMDPAAMGASDDHHTKLEGVRILVVDDQEDARTMLKMILDREGATVWTAESSRAAQTELAEHTPDIILSDIGMPEENGYALMRKVREKGDAIARIPAIALTAYAHPADRERALEAGFQLHLSKPVAPSALVDAIDQLVRGGMTRPNFQESI